MTQMQEAGRGTITTEIREVAANERVDTDQVRTGIADGTIVLPRNSRRSAFDYRAIGAGLSVKVNANIGTSPDRMDLDEELAKQAAAVEAGADSIMDLSTGGDLDVVRKALLERCPLPFGTVPIYEVAVRLARRERHVTDMDETTIMEVIEAQAKSGVDFMTIHSGLTRQALSLLEGGGRLTGVVSRGGSFIARWIKANDRENPFYTLYDRILEVAREYDVTLSLGDGLRPGSLADATDRPQVHELLVLGELVDRARAAGVQAMVEGPGHVPLDQVETNIKLEKQLCRGAPFYVLGPLVTDVSPGYDHITAAIGGALAAMAGADFLCYVTPTEHLALPGVEDVREGVYALRIAAHAADVARGNPRAREWDDNMSRARANLDWESMMKLAINPERARQIRGSSLPTQEEVCTMCGQFCAMRDLNQPV
ncbi:phosphomethylpyrimidine synthase ThiC [candidate division KSB1 bacterium]